MVKLNANKVTHILPNAAIIRSILILQIVKLSINVLPLSIRKAQKDDETSSVISSFQLQV